MNRIRTFVLAVVMMVVGASGCGARTGALSIVCLGEASLPEALAAREIRRYVYLRTGALMPIVEADAVASGECGAVVVGSKDRPHVKMLAADAGLETAVAALGPQHYLIKTIQRDGKRVVLIAGGDEVGTLYGVYRLAEHLGVRF